MIKKIHTFRENINNPKLHKLLDKIEEAPVDFLGTDLEYARQQYIEWIGDIETILIEIQNELNNK